ncbi:MAG: XRE family transcriptional regulator [Pseudonocardiaceae bacterium]
MAVANGKLRAMREATPSRVVAAESMGRAELAEAVNQYLWKSRFKRYDLDAHTIARYERGTVRWPSEPYREGLRAVLDAATDAELGFRPTRRGSTAVASTSAVSMSLAPDYDGSVDLGVSPAEFLARTSVDTPVPTRVGWTEVEHVRATTRAVAMSENLFGGGLSCEAARGQLRWAGNLLEAHANNDVRRALLEAVGNLSGVVAFSAFDIANHHAADRCFQFALWCAQQADAWALRANTLAEMSRKAAYLGHRDDALSMIEFAQVRADRVSATARAMLWTLRARQLALSGRHGEAQTDVQRADAYFEDRDPATDPPWLVYYDMAEHQGSTGKALIPVAREMNRPGLAAPRLENAIRLQDADYPRSRTFSRTRLAALTMAIGDPREAASMGRQAVTDAAPLWSQRIVTELHGLARVSEQHGHIGEVAELQYEITRLVLPRV